MIRLGLRLTLGGGREAAVRLVMVAVAVAIGVGMLLTTLASLNAVNTQNARYAWLETGYTGSNAPATTGAAAARDPLWWRLSADLLPGQRDRSGRRRSDRARLADPSRHRQTAREGTVLRFARAGEAAA